MSTNGAPRLRSITLAASLILCISSACLTSAAADEAYGPTNLLRTLKTPFGAPQDASESTSSGSAELTPIGIAPSQSPLRRSLADRLVPVRLYLPGRMVIGRPAEFVIKARPGSWAALAMAEKDSGAKPVYGHTLRLSADRKLVSVGRIPESGVLSLYVETPVQGDLIGQQLYFEAAVWSKDDMSDMQIAAPVSSEGQGTSQNGVLIAAESEQKRGIRIVPDSSVPLMQREGRGGTVGLDSGRP